MQGADITEERRRILRRNADQFQDEINLQDLYFVLLKQKKVILFTLAVCVIASVLYVMFATEIYKVSARIIIPVEEDLILRNQITEKNEPERKINQAQSLIIIPGKKIDPAIKIFIEFQTFLLKDETWNDFVDGHKKLFKPQQQNKQRVLSNPLALGKDKSFVGKHVRITYESSDLDNINIILNQYINFAKQGFIENLVSARQRRIARDIDTLKLDIEQARRTEVLKRKDEIELIQNDLALAKKLGIIDYRQLTLNNQSKLIVVAGDMNVPRYMRGTKVLNAELESLQNRAAVDAYIPGLRDTQQKLENLKAIKFDAERFSPFILDGSVQKAQKIKPKSRLILTLGFVLGIFLGLFMAFVAEFVQKTRKSQATESISNP